MLFAGGRVAVNTGREKSFYNYVGVGVGIVVAHNFGKDLAVANAADTGDDNLIVVVADNTIAH